jgi:DNA-binding transcriptional regulator YhcF (GntR family)
LKISFESLIPVYVQIAEAIEADIINGKLSEGGPAYSQLIIARDLNVNPATAAKGINMLVSKGILEKQRGASMTVTAGALERLLKERRDNGFRELLDNLVSEAVKISLSEDEVIREIKNRFKDMEAQ